MITSVLLDALNHNHIRTPLGYQSSTVPTYFRVWTKSLSEKVQLHGLLVSKGKERYFPLRLLLVCHGYTVSMYSKYLMSVHWKTYATTGQSAGHGAWKPTVFHYIINGRGSGSLYLLLTTHVIDARKLHLLIQLHGSRRRVLCVSKGAVRSLMEDNWADKLNQAIELCIKRPEVKPQRKLLWGPAMGFLTSSCNRLPLALPD